MIALAPHWGALLALALFLVAGLAVLDDYGVIADSFVNALRAATVWAFLARADDLFSVGDFSIRLYGPSFELALLFAERSLGIEGGRSVHLAQHLLTHLAFLTGGLFAYLLARRLSGNSLIGLFAMLLFLLHPRLYAHSFFNSHDIAFVVAFIVALFLAHRAFKRDTLGAFALLGVGVGIAVNLRIMGVILLAAIPALRALDLALASSWEERKRVLLATGAFSAASLLTAYALLPYLWADPLARAAEWWTTLSDHPYKPSGLFRGLPGQSAEFPEYIPVWFLITSPPFALLLGLVGGALILLRAVKAPLEALRNTRLRFGLLLTACFALPILAVVLLNSNSLHYGWRHMYFLWAPFSLLAAWGLHRLGATLSARRLRAAAYGTAGAGLAATVISMTLIHPNQQLFFNFSVDRVTPEYLRSQYTMAYWRHPMRQALEWLSDNADLLPDRTAALTGTSSWKAYGNLRILPDAARARIEERAGFSVVGFAWWGSSRSAPPMHHRRPYAVTNSRWGASRSARVLHRVQVYDNTVYTIERKDDLRAVYDATRGREPDAVAAYDIHRLDDAVALVMEPCAPAFIERVNATLRATPVDQSDLPPWRDSEQGALRYFPFSEYGAFFDGKCVASLPLPDYPIADLAFIWEPKPLARETALEAMRRAKEKGQLLARAEYDVYLANGELAYVQEQCDPLETEHPFRVSVFSERADDSPERRRGWDREIHEFEFHQRGALLKEGACAALFPLPDYPIAAIRTAQYIEGGDDLWEAAFSTNPGPYAAAYRAVAGSAPLAEGAFDLHLLNGDLVYVKEPCEQAYTEARFFLHVVPDRVGDLPEERRKFGFDNLDFAFFLNGAWFDGRCAARVPLPSYSIASVRTGQFVRGAGETWSAEFVTGGSPSASQETDGRRRYNREHAR